MAWIRFNRPKVSTRRKRTGHPKRRIPSQSTDLHDLRCIRETQQDLQQSPFSRPQLDLRHAVPRRGLECSPEPSVFRMVRPGRVIEDLWGGIPLSCPGTLVSHRNLRIVVNFVALISIFSVVAVTIQECPDRPHRRQRHHRILHWAITPWWTVLQLAAWRKCFARSSHGQPGNRASSF